MYKDKIDSYFEKNADRMVEAICRLIKIKSVMGEAKEGKPFGEGPAEALAEALKIAADLGFSPVNLDNYVGFMDLNKKETELTVLAHLDVVPEGGGWTKPAFEGTVENGKIFGRGADDDKGPAMASLFAFAAAKEIEPELSKNARLVLGTSEESGVFADIKYYFEHEKPSPMTFSPDIGFPVINTEKGRFRPLFEASWEESKALPRIVSIKGGDTLNQVPDAASAIIEGAAIDLLEEFADMIAEYSGAEFSFEEENNFIKISAKGKNAHALEPDKGNNALTAIIFLLSHFTFAKSESYEMVCKLNSLFPHGDIYGKEIGLEQKDELSGPLTLNLSIMDFGLTGFTARFDCRFPVCGTKDSVYSAAEKKFRENGITIAEENLVMPHHTPAESPFVQTLLKAYEEYTGLKGECIATGGGTYVHDIEGGVAFGCAMPGTDTHVHGADEFAVISELITSAKIFTKVILDICK